MGMRFHRSIRIAKGFSINFSKKGIGFSVGPRGAKMSVGPNGTYINAGVPGTGMYFRNKISGGNSFSSQTPLPYSVFLKLDDKTGEITVYNEDNEIIVDPYLLRRIKKTEGYKVGVAQLFERLKEAVENNINSFVQIYKATPKVLSDDNWQNKIEILKKRPLMKYHSSPFSLPKPSIETVKYEAENLAQEAAKRVSFWKRKKFIKKFIEEKSKELLEQRLKEWQKKKEEFEQSEKEKEKIFNEKYALERKQEIAELEQIVDGDEKAIHQSIESFLKDLQLPFEISVEYELEGETIKADLHLPSIEEIETRKVSMTQRGKISVKSRTKTEINQDYAQGICGLAFYFAGHFFNISPRIKKVLISGYAERISPKTGHPVNEYLYSIIFTKDKFRELIFENIDPVAAFDNFEHRMNMLKNFNLKPIEPF